MDFQEGIYALDDCIHYQFNKQVERTPEAIALFSPSSEKLTYSQLNQLANRLANYLRERGVDSETIVGICMDRSPEMVAALLGILKAGGAYLPLDPAYPSERLAFMLEDSGATFLLTDERTMQRLPRGEFRLVQVDREKPVIARYPPTDPSDPTTGENLAYIIYTSGSTGQPKGVMGLHKGAINRFEWMWQTYPFKRGEVCCQKTALSFVDSVWEIFGPLLRGVPSMLLSDEESKDPEQMVRLLAEYGVTRLVLVPSVLEAILESHSDLNERLAKLKHWTCSGEALPIDLVRCFHERLPGRILLNIYGASEISADATFSEISQVPLGDKVPIGRPISGMCAYLLDENMQPTAPGEMGELYFGGKGLGRGYLNRPRLTAERFVPDFISGDAGARLYRTGDLARVTPDRMLEYVGRSDQQVKIRGTRIELGEIENLLRRHPAIRQAVVIVREDTPSDKRLAAYVVRVQDTSVGASELRTYLQSKLPGVMIPSVFVIMDALPLTPSGKIDRLSLPVPGTGGYRAKQEFIPPRNPLEISLVQLWQQILGIDRVGIEDNFFTLGGHSLLAARLISHLRVDMGIELSLRAVFESPTVAALAETIQAYNRSDAIADKLPEIKPVQTRDRAPLSFFQQRLWFLEQLTPYTPTYNETIAFRLLGTLDLPALERSLAEIIRRHETLRTTFTIVGEQPLQIIHAAEEFRLAVIDLIDQDAEGYGDPSNLETRLNQALTEQVQQYFNLRDGPLIRVIIFTLGNKDHVLQVVMHHTVCDEWSLGVLQKEISALYNANSQGSTPVLVQIPFQYTDYSAWQREWMQGTRLDNLVAYSKGQLGGELPVLILPNERPRPVVQTFRGANYYLKIPAALVDGLKRLSQLYDVTLFMTTLAAFKTLLHRYSGQTDIVVGSPVANRDPGGSEHLIGFFVNTLALRSDLSGNPSFEILLSRIKEMTLAAFEHQALPFEKLVEALQPERNLSYTPLFQVMFAFQNTPHERLRMSGLEVNSLVVESQVARFDLSLYLEEIDQEMVVTFNYSTDLFDEAIIERMAGHLRILLEEIVAHPERRISDLNILGPAERRQLLFGWNDTSSSWSLEPYCSVHQLIEAQAATNPEAIALVFEGEALTYGELDRRANQLAHFLRSRGTKQETRVGLYMDRSLEMFVGVLGIMKAGGAYMPLDREYPWERLAFMLKDSGAKTLLTKSTLLPNNARIQDVTIICLDQDIDLIRLESEINPHIRINPDNLVYVIYTTGSTGKPKGVEVEHRQLLNYVFSISERLGLKAGMNYAMVQPLAVDSVLTVVFPSLCTGGALHVLSREESLDALAVSEYFQQNSIDCVKITPSHLAALQAQGSVKALFPKRFLILGGEASRWEWAQELLLHAGDCQIINHYGPTETTVGVLALRMGLEQGGKAYPTMPLGCPLANTKIYILDDYLQPVPVGVPGELYIGGANVSRGYLNRLDLTAQHYIPDPFAGSQNPGGRLYKTGDRARYLPDGNVEFLGRRDYQVKIRGFRVELGEIEAVLSEYPAIREAVVVYRDFKNFPGERRLVAYYVSIDNQVLSSGELRNFLSEKLPNYMLPSFFVHLQKLPLLQNGKVDRAALPDPEQKRSDSKEFKAPRSHVEMILVEIWSDVLNLEQIGVDDNFFEIGGHSLLAAQMINHINDVFQIIVPLRSLFEHPTTAELALVIEEQLLVEIENLEDEEVLDLL